MDYQPRSGLSAKKKRRDRLIQLAHRHAEWAVGFADEVWWSRLAQPALHAWALAQQPLRLIEQRVAKDDPDRKALACYGALLSCPAAPASLPEQVWLRFVQGRPVSVLTIQFLEWLCAKLQGLGKTVCCLIWDNASWHLSQAVRRWLQTHNRQVKQSGQGVRLLCCYLPVKSPWLNRIEPHWLHAKRRIVEPDRLLSAAEVEERVCTRFGCSHEPPLAIPENVA